jgi:hypothetical protein
VHGEARRHAVFAMDMQRAAGRCEVIGAALVTIGGWVDRLV